MPIDPSILLQGQPVVLPDPLNSLAKVSQIQNFKNQNSLAQMQVEKAQSDAAQQKGLSRAYSDAIDPATGAINATKLVSSLAAGGNGSAIPAAQKTLAESQKAQREAEMGQIDNAYKKQNLIAQYAGSAKDQVSWTASKQAAAALGVDVSALPDQYDPAVAQQLRDRALTGVQQLEQHWKAKGFDLDLQKANESARHDVATEGLTARGQNMTDARSREANAQSFSKPFEVTGPNGQPVLVRQDKAGKVMPVPGFGPKAGGGKLTEDQGKATGWLVQAQNAFDNMKASTDPKTGTPSAAKPGLNDMIGNIPYTAGIAPAIANSLRGADRQKFIQAGSSLSEALLRAATGAGVNHDEAVQKVAELTPQTGDTDELIKQKMAAIPLYIETLKVRAGPGANMAAGVLNSRNTPMPAGNEGWSVTEVK